MPVRYLHPFAEELLQLKPMLMLGGPRQVGKTTLALSMIQQISGTPLEEHPAYLNWDVPGVSQRLKLGELPPHQTRIILDEIHKFKSWRNLVKGLYDSKKSTRQFIITGSAKLHHYRKGGDSLVGRYFHLRLHPLSLTELNKSPNSEDLASLLKWGGFPEPFFKANEKFHALWHRQRMTQIIREDLRDLEQVREISIIEQLAEALPDRVGSLLSIKSLHEDLAVDPKTIERWITIFENLYICFRISPYGAPKIKSIKKAQKLYFWDWSAIPNAGDRLENLVASHLLKYCHLKEDTEGSSYELRYLRDTLGHEVDFVVLKNKKPVFAVECKTGEKAVSSSIYYFKDRTPIPAFYQIHLGSKNYEKDSIRVLPFTEFCKELGLP